MYESRKCSTATEEIKNIWAVYTDIVETGTYHICASKDLKMSTERPRTVRSYSSVYCVLYLFSNISSIFSPRHSHQPSVDPYFCCLFFTVI